MLHLLRKKKRRVKKFLCEPHDHMVDHLAEANALLSGLALYPQLFNTLRTQDASVLSPVSFGILAVANIIWTIYGIHRRDVAVTLASVLVVISSTGLTFASLLWRA